MTNTYTTIVKKSILLVICLFPYGSFANQAVKPENTVILLDLSDRLLIPNQGSRDTAIIMEAWRSFEKKAKSRLIVTCKNRFSIVLAPQENTPPELLNVQQTLSIDLGSIPPAQKLKALQNFSATFPSKIARIYRLAIRGKQSSDYPGTDIWRYFDEQLYMDAPAEYQNKLIVLTDGYFDFEHSQDKFHTEFYHTTTNFLKSLPQIGWSEYAIRTKTGLLPVSRKFPDLQVFVACLHSKTKRQDETAMLAFFWREWLKTMNVTKTETFPNSIQIDRIVYSFKN